MRFVVHGSPKLAVEVICLCLADKLQETKKRDAEIKAAAKSVRDEEKEKKRQEKVAERVVFREERAMTGRHSRRANKDAREVMQIILDVQPIETALSSVHGEGTCY